MAVLAAGTTIGGVDVVAELRRLGAGGVSGGGGASSTASADRADVAIKLMTARTIRVNLASSSAVPFDGTANITPGITGILPKANGGTGNTVGTVDQLSSARLFTVNLAKSDGVNFDGTANAEIGVTGVLPVEKGGTGTTTGIPDTSKLKNPRNLGVNLAKAGTVSFDGSADATLGVSGILPIANGGTGNNAGIAEYAKSLAQSCVLGVLLNSNAMANFDGTTGVLFGCTGVLPIEKGGTGQSGMEGTDYNTIRYRGIAFVQGTPAVGPVNGGMIFTYV